jgi:hypothetical protein
MDFSTKEKSTTFFYNGEDKKDGWVALRTLTVEKLQDISKACTTIVYKKRRGGRREREEVVDEKKSSRMQWDYIITGWGKTTDDGVELECTTDNKLLLMNKSPQFAMMIGEYLDSLNEEMAVEAEEEVKN